MIPKFFITTVALIAWSSAAGTVLAADTKTQISAAPVQGQWVAVIIAVFLFACVAVGCFKSAKRGHQD